MSVELQNCTYDVSLCYIIKNVKRFFNPSQKISINSSTFAEGWYFNVVSAQAVGTKPVETDNDKPEDNDKQADGLGIYLYPPTNANSLPLTVTSNILITSLSGMILAKASFCHLFEKDIDGWGFANLLTANHLSLYPSCQQEDRVILRCTFKAPSLPDPRDGLPFGLIYRALKRDAAGEADVCFKVFNVRDRTGNLGDPRDLFCDLEFLTTRCGAFENIFANPHMKCYPVRPNLRGDTPLVATFQDDDSDFKEPDHGETVDGGDSGTVCKDPKSTEEASENAELLPSSSIEDGRHEADQKLESSTRPRTASSTDGTKDNLGCPIQLDHDVEGQVDDVDANKKAIIVNKQSEEGLAKLEAAEADPHRSILTVVVKGYSQVTFEALLYYLYTGDVEFAPLKSEGEEARKRLIEDYTTRYPFRPRPCSCKSMYRLASQLKVEHLQALALQHLKRQLKTTTIVHEIFSPLTARCADVRTLEMDILLEHWDRIEDSKEFQDKLEDLTSGRYPDRGKVLAEIFRRIARRNREGK
ncbi:hypothetical protein NLI96_g4967 [Meripilus lineatus]|uniref:BTB domain-containing protein n=1 Tax=Meripilus lineatus TaxID=2056292 RepID=A0AAD5V8S4_9APHY|nr:hypothetical protein NLI96_g4967 [Physisporinus lineatus]